MPLFSRNHTPLDLPGLFMNFLNKSGNSAMSDYDDKDPISKARHSKSKKSLYFNIDSIDSAKILLILVLLAMSIFMLRYKSKPSGYINRNSNANITLDPKIDENPYGFQPFYKVHERVKYKNPVETICKDIDPKRALLLTILSRASNVHIREAIRQTWGATRVYHGISIHLIFIVGIDDGMTKQIETEQNIYHDLIQVNLPENYPVVSYKELACLCWSKYFCPNIRFQFKADEDVHLNTPLIAGIIASMLKNRTLPNEPIMYGWFRHKSRVDRVGRYLITEEEYPGYYYPPYTFGIGYLMTRAGRDQLCNSASRPHPVTRVGDAYITGILRDHALVQYARLGDFHYIYSYTLSGERCIEYFNNDPKLMICMSSLHSGISDVADEYVRVWKTIYQEADSIKEKHQN